MAAAQLDELDRVKWLRKTEDKAKILYQSENFCSDDENYAATACEFLYVIWIVHFLPFRVHAALFDIKKSATP